MLLTIHAAASFPAWTSKKYDSSEKKSILFGLNNYDCICFDCAGIFEIVQIDAFSGGKAKKPQHSPFVAFLREAIFRYFVGLMFAKTRE